MPRMSRLPGAGGAIPFLCLLSVGPGAANAAYTCTGLGFECLDRIYTGASSYGTESAAKAACDERDADKGALTRLIALDAEGALCALHTGCATKSPAIRHGFKCWCRLWPLRLVY